MISGTPQHDAIKSIEVVAASLDCGDAAIQDNGQVRPHGLQARHKVIIKRRNIAVLLRAQAFKPSLARVNGENLATCCADFLDKIKQSFFRWQIINGDAALYRDRDGHAGFHGVNAGGYFVRPRHQASSERA